ncbi:hypothetical protein P7K49_027241 [Saguinus oedipus]|uniref:Uncharacterized protein n=1 Tax=Saguinus oedipus TaxID=9490 RepID=A0ABQ9UA37_SAGOE|nr:hypothetical protein P7K49_027241 [Saguinus oedipus]
MGGALAWTVLLPLQLPESDGRELSCAINRLLRGCGLEHGVQGHVPELQRPWPEPAQNQSLRASEVLLDLSGNRLRELPVTFFASLRKPQLLNVLQNPLSRVDWALAARCDVDPQDALASWHEVQRDNCSGLTPLLCWDTATRSQRNLSAFLVVSCAPAWPLRPSRWRGPAGACFSGLPSLAPCWPGDSGGGAWPEARTWTSPGLLRMGPSPVQACSHGKAAGTPTSPGDDLKNEATREQGAPSWKGPLSWVGAVFAQAHPSEDNDFYMNYEDFDLASQPVYCNLQSLGQAPVDDEEDVSPRC